MKAKINRQGSYIHIRAKAHCIFNSYFVSSLVTTTDKGVGQHSSQEWVCFLGKQLGGAAAGKDIQTIPLLCNVE